MKRVLLLAACLLLTTVGFSQRHAMMSPGGAHAPEAPDAPKGGEQIHWMNIDDVQAAMRKQPKKVWMDVYTDWCGWCKRMDKTTFENPNVVKYMNEHFYAVKLDAEQKEDIRFMGKMFRANPTDRTHPFAKEMLHDQLSYPTSIFMEENFQTPQVIPGYLDVKQMEMILKYVAEGVYKKTPFPEYQANFKPTWAAE